MALEVPCLVVAAAQLTVVNATTQQIKPVLAFAIKGECHHSFFYLCKPTAKPDFPIMYPPMGAR